MCALVHKLALTLSITVNDKSIDISPTALKPIDAANPGRPMSQNIVTEKVLKDGGDCMYDSNNEVFKAHVIKLRPEERPKIIIRNPINNL